MGNTLYPIRRVFKEFYNVTLEIGRGKTVKTDGLDKLPQNIRANLEKWLETHKEHVLERLKIEK